MIYADAHHNIRTVKTVIINSAKLNINKTTNVQIVAKVYNYLFNHTTV